MILAKAEQAAIEQLFAEFVWPPFSGSWKNANIVALAKNIAQWTGKCFNALFQTYGCNAFGPWGFVSVVTGTRGVRKHNAGIEHFTPSSGGSDCLLCSKLELLANISANTLALSTGSVHDRSTIKIFMYILQKWKYSATSILYYRV